MLGTLGSAGAGCEGFAPPDSWRRSTCLKTSTTCQTARYLGVRHRRFRSSSLLARIHISEDVNNLPIASKTLCQHTAIGPTQTSMECKALPQKCELALSLHVSASGTAGHQLLQRDCNDPGSPSLPLAAQVAFGFGGGPVGAVATTFAPCTASQAPNSSTASARICSAPWGPSPQVWKRQPPGADPHIRRRQQLAYCCKDSAPNAHSSPRLGIWPRSRRWHLSETFNDKPRRHTAIGPRQTQACTSLSSLGPTSPTACITCRDSEIKLDRSLLHLAEPVGCARFLRKPSPGIDFGSRFEFGNGSVPLNNPQGSPALVWIDSHKLDSASCIMTIQIMDDGHILKISPGWTSW